MPSILTSITINASPEKVRAVFLDFPSHNEWNALFKDVSIYSDPRELAQGSIVKATLQSMNRDMYPTVHTNTAEELSWDGKLGARFLFNGHHSFKFEKNDDGTTNFINREDFTGPLATVFFMFSDLKKVETEFIRMNNGLKEYVENL